jgi:peptidoglycan/LPS O-acetylase OafA/YrhL
VLSGFILAKTFRHPNQPGAFNPWRFWQARFARVYPVYLVSLVVSAPFAWHAIVGENPSGAWPQFGLHAGAALGLIQAWIPGWAFSWNGPSWSLSVEAFFYAAFPFLMVARPRTRLQWLLVAALTGTALLVGGRLMPSLNPLTGLQRVLGWANPLLWLPLFLLGIAMSELPRTAPAIATRLEQAARSSWACWLVTLMIAVIMALNLQRWSQLLYCYALAPLCAVLIGLIASGNNPFTRMLSGKVLVLLGEASYSLYILHRPIHQWLDGLAVGGWLPSTHTTSGFVLYLTISLGLSILSLKLIEYPCRQWIRQRGPRRPDSPPLNQNLPSVAHLQSTQ